VFEHVISDYNTVLDRNKKMEIQILTLAFGNWAQSRLQTTARQAFRDQKLEEWLMNPGTIGLTQVCLRCVPGLRDLGEVGMSPFCCMVTAATSRGARIWLTRLGVLALPPNMRDSALDKSMSQSAVAWLNGRESLTAMSALRVAALTHAWQQEDSVAMARSLQWYGRWLDRMQDVLDVSAQKRWLDEQQVAWAPVIGVVESVEKAVRDVAREQEAEGASMQSLFDELKHALSVLNFNGARDMASTADGVRSAMSLVDCAERWEGRSGLYMSELLMDAIQACEDLIRERAIFRSNETFH
jgi:hypothetical protein